MMGCDGEGVMEWIFVVLRGHDEVRWRRGHGMDLRGIVIGVVLRECSSPDLHAAGRGIECTA